MVETETIAFRMQLGPGSASEYRCRHDAIWPDLTAALEAVGVLDYRIFHDQETGALFAVLTRRADHTMGALPALPVMQRWWAMMADIMETEPDSSPRQRALDAMFHLKAGGQP